MDDKLVEVLRPDKGDKVMPVHQIKYHGKPVKANAWYGYGVFANAPAGTSARLTRLNGCSGNRIITPDAPEDRPDSESGECGIFHPATGSKVHFKANGDIEVSGAKLTIKAASDELLAVLADLCDAIGAITVDDTDGSAGGVWALKQFADVEAIKARLEAMTA